MTANDLIHSNQPLRSAVLSNPKSGRNLRYFSKIKEVLDKYPETSHREASTPAEVAEALEELAGDEPELLIINSGDGTIAAVQTALFNRRPFAKPPIFALLRGGTSNITTTDIGIRDRHTKGLEKLLTWARRPHTHGRIVARPTLRVSHGLYPEPLCGMFFGCGSVTTGTKYCREHLQNRSLRDTLVPTLCTLRVVYALIRRDPRFIAGDAIGTEITTDEAHLVYREENHFLLAATALNRLFLNLNPFWGTEKGQLHYTAIRSNPAYALRAMPFLFWGRKNRYVTPENGYFSRNFNQLRLTMNSPFALDGEEYEADENQGPVIIDNAGEIRYLLL